MAKETAYDVRFQAPMTMQVIGQTGAGKSFWVKRLLENAQQVIHPAPQKIIYCYGEWQPLFDEMQKIPNLQFEKELTESLVSRENLKNQRTLLIIDDLADEVSPKLMTALYTKYSHHRHVSCVLLLQNLFFQGLSSLRNLAVNTHYYVLFRSPRDHGSISTMGRQMYGPQYKSFVAAYEDACSEKFGHLIVDSKADTPWQIRLRTRIFPNETTVAYVIKRK